MTCTWRSLAASAAVVTVVALLAAGCSDEDGAPDGGGSPNTGGPTTSAGAGTTAPAPTPTTGPGGPTPVGCGGSAADADPATVSVAAADADGDGLPDVVQTYRSSGGQWRLRVEFGSGGSAEAVLEGQGLGAGGATALGGAELGAGSGDEVFVRIGGDDGTSQVALFTVADCGVMPLRLAGNPVLFGVAATPGFISGVQCGPASSGGGTALYVGEGTPSGSGWSVTTTEYLVREGELEAAGDPVVNTATTGDEAYVAASTFSCGGAVLVG